MSKLILFLLLFIEAISSEEVPNAKTPFGPVIGQIKETRFLKKFSSFEGIPYAEPPILNLRFEEPKEIVPWSIPINATTPTKCAQTNMFRADLFEGIEDCLHLNIYVPRTSINQADNLPVLIHIHGGAFMFGSGHEYANPDFFMERDVIFVTFNYRLGILGFLSTEDQTIPGNMGLKDQQLALKFIKNVITSFGGNSNSITLTGMSAGAGSTHLHYFSPKSWPYFNRGFSQSGTAFNFWTRQHEALSKFHLLAEASKCNGTTSQLVDCLKQQPVKELLLRIAPFYGYRTFPNVIFGPIIEKNSSNPFLSERPSEAILKKQIYDAPWIASTAQHEGFLLLQMLYDSDSKEEDDVATRFKFIDKNWEKVGPFLLDFNYTKGERMKIARSMRQQYFEDSTFQEKFHSLLELFSDRMFTYDAQKALLKQAELNKSPVHYLLLDFPNNHKKLNITTHADDIRFYFGALPGQIPIDQDEMEVCNVLMDFLVHYAKTGEAKIAGINSWKAVTPQKLNAIKVSKQIEEKVVEIDKDREAFWKNLPLD